jgi:hypothetical protein
VATDDQIAELRLFTAEYDESSYTDEALGLILDASSSTKVAASTVWTQKAAKYAALVNVSESGSSRNLSDLHQNALRMAATLGAGAEEDTVESTGIRIRRLTRQ